MQSVLLYIMTVLIWGSTWLAIEFQLGTVNEIVSLCLRFSLAALCMWGYVLFKRLPMYFDLKTHGFFILLAMGNFGLNYLMLYYAQGYLNSAMASIAFSLLLIFNIINTRLFFGKPIAKRIYSGALFGVAGIVALFWHDLSQFDLSNGAIVGLGLALLGTLIASFGNMVSVRNSNKGIGVLQGNAWGMLYSSVLLAVFALLNGETFVINASWQYWSSLIYLAVFGTVIAFASYFSLLKNIGPERASYIIVLFPLVAVLLSTYFEGFTWQANTFVGFSLVLLGNAIVLTPFDKLKAHFAASPVRT
ncbi:DMT family transporter [Pseudoalteromonas aurantia]|uniref:EamA family transporter n=1 Tax=Pseudoalteromonas aurantia TaxID=43654 RepID=A0A5S3VA45_9GAMM|nr:EamA family transporter [Pseudoalteromonas aurantia]TMO67709.1 EamA family transporter [Pseudoalteromonas aurantia]TMO68715.1 EamA family transporter [Pseudoalteromonas aurantia]TMO78960.1 EamA family transporter [Pseudoalteromonas aurantia]